MPGTISRITCLQWVSTCRAIWIGQVVPSAQDKMASPATMRPHRIEPAGTALQNRNRSRVNRCSRPAGRWQDPGSRDPCRSQFVPRSHPATVPRQNRIAVRFHCRGIEQFGWLPRLLLPGERYLSGLIALAGRERDPQLAGNDAGNDRRAGNFDIFAIEAEWHFQSFASLPFQFESG